MMDDIQSKGMSGSIVDEIREAIRRRANPEGAEKAKRFFKEPIETYCLSSPPVDEIAKQFYPKVKGDLGLAVDVAGKLIGSRVLDEASGGIRLMRRISRFLTPETFEVLDGWVDDLTNWANTDGLST